MPREAGGNYRLPEDDVTSGTTILAEWANSTLNDLATAMTDSLSRTGVGGMSSPMKVPKGDATEPAYTFTEDVTTGRYLQTQGIMVEAISGVDVVRYTANGIEQKVAGGSWEPIANQDASEVPYDDSVTNFGVNNVQDAIEAASVIDDTYVNLTGAQTISGLKTFSNGLELNNNASVKKLTGDNLVGYDSNEDATVLGNTSDDVILVSKTDQPRHIYPGGDATVLTTDNIGAVLLDQFYEVGSLYFGQTDPSVKWPGSSWTKLSGRFIVAAGESTTGLDSFTFNDGDELGTHGERLSEDQMPRHNHGLYQSLLSQGGVGASGISTSGNQGDSPVTYWKGGDPGGGNADGPGQVHNNIPAYHAVHIWRRVS